MLKPAFQPLMLAAAILAGTAIGGHAVLASDHDDGTTDLKTLNTNLTDLFVFNEASHNGTALGPTNNDVVLVMNVNPRALPQQQYYFHTDAQYDFNVHRLDGDETKNAAIPVAEPTKDLTLRLQFGAPDATTNRQSITLTRFDQTTVQATTATTRQYPDGTDAFTPSAGTMVTTPHTMGLPDAGTVVTARAGTTPGRRNFTQDKAIVNTATLDGKTVSVFAGLREDPFFFDVEQFFKVRGTLARKYGGSSESYQVFDRSTATDFTAGYNVLSIVLRVPRSLLQGSSSSTRFDVWETVSVRI